MKLQKVFAYKYAGKPHYKYLITIPEETIQTLGWKPGGEIDFLIEEYEKLVGHEEYEKWKEDLPISPERRGMLHLLYVSDPIDEPKEAPAPKMTYEEFRNKIHAELRANPPGLSWSELREKIKLPQNVPNNKWVHQLENDIGLIRIKEVKGLVWKLK